MATVIMFVGAVCMFLAALTRFQPLSALLAVPFMASVLLTVDGANTRMQILVLLLCGATIAFQAINRLRSTRARRDLEKGAQLIQMIGDLVSGGHDVSYAVELGIQLEGSHLALSDVEFSSLVADHGASAALGLLANQCNSKPLSGFLASLSFGLQYGGVRAVDSAASAVADAKQTLKLLAERQLGLAIYRNELTLLSLMVIASLGALWRLQNSSVLSEQVQLLSLSIVAVFLTVGLGCQLLSQLRGIRSGYLIGAIE